MTNVWELVLTGSAGGVALVAGGLALRSQWRTTLAGVWAWRIGSTVLLLLLATGTMVRRTPFDWTPFFYLAGLSLFCPNIALLGAKRPQHRVWHLVVATLWLILALPAVQAAWLYPGRALNPGLIRGGFLWFLIGLEILNRSGSGTVFLGVLAATSEIVLLGTFLPGWPAAWKAAEPLYWPSLAALGLLALAHLSDYILSSQPNGGEEDLARWWLFFRRRFGLLWALRVWLQINSFCQSQGWPVRLGWNSFVNLDGAAVAPQRVLSAKDYLSLRQAFVNLLLRFEDPLRFNYPSVQ